MKPDRHNLSRLLEGHHRLAEPLDRILADRLFQTENIRLERPCKNIFFDGEAEMVAPRRYSSLAAFCNSGYPANPNDWANRTTVELEVFPFWPSSSALR